jgi:hypothetical protein
MTETLETTDMPELSADTHEQEPATEAPSPGKTEDVAAAEKAATMKTAKLNSSSLIKKPGGKAGRKPKSTKADILREHLTADIISYYLAGKTIPETMNDLGVAEGMVIRVRANVPPEIRELFTRAKTNELRSLIEDGVRAQLLALRKIVEVTNDEVWIKSQRAPELATFFGVVSDKTTRVLIAIDRGIERERFEERQRETLPEPREVDNGRGPIRGKPGIAVAEATARA